MIASTHLTAGAASGLLIQNCLPVQSGIPERVLAGFFAGLLSHILLDAIPHREYGVSGHWLGLTLLAETILVFALVFDFGRPPAVNLVIFTAMVGAAVPDLFDLFYGYLVSWEWLRTSNRFVHAFHAKPSSVYELDFGAQALISSLAVMFIKFRSAF